MSVTAKELNNKSFIINRMENNIREKFCYIPAHHPGMNVTEIGSVTVVNSGLPSDTFNTCYGGKITSDLANEVFQYYQEKQFPMAWWLGPSSQAEGYEDLLKAAGFEHDEHDVGMVADLTKLDDSNEISGELTIKQCQSPEEFKDFGEVLSSIFHPYPEENQVKTFYQQITAVPEENRTNLKLFVGYLNGEAVSTSGLFLTDCAGVFDISTRPEHRQKGYGSALFYHALSEAKSLGFEVSVLQASPDGLNIYKRFGFSEIGDFNVWSNAHAITA